MGITDHDILKKFFNLASPDGNVKINVMYHNNKAKDGMRNLVRTILDVKEDRFNELLKKVITFTHQHDGNFMCKTK